MAEPQIRASTEYDVQAESDIARIAASAKEYAESIGFGPKAAEELTLVVRELAANVLDHANGGNLTLAELSQGEKTGMRIESSDAGPGFAEVDDPFEDGYSTMGSLGAGLGTVNRLSDSVYIADSVDPSLRTIVRADRWVRPPYEATMDCPLDFGAVSRPKVQGTPNGDSFVIKRWGDRALVGVIDGLGHGAGAHRAAMAARSYVERHFDQPFDAIFTGTDRACQGTRGVVMALARFDWRAETVELAGIGNISCKVENVDSSIVTRRGVLGGTSPSAVVRTIDWDPANRFVFHSDGVTTRWDLADCTDIVAEPAGVQARRILDRYGKHNDDETVLVVAPKP